VKYTNKQKHEVIPIAYFVKTKELTSDKMKVCVNCGAEILDKRGQPLNQVYDKALSNKSGIIRLVECSSCGQVADKYIEYEGCLVLLDLALQYQPAFRHTLVNQNRRTLILKMVFLTLIVDGYTRWFFSADGGRFFEREAEFYAAAGLAAISLVTFIFTALVTILAAQFVRVRTTSPDYVLLVYGLLLAYCTRFLKLAALLWGSQSTSDSTLVGSQSTLESTQFLWYFVDILYLLTSVNVMKVLSGLGSLQSTVTAVVAHAALHLVDLYNNNSFLPF